MNARNYFDRFFGPVEHLFAEGFAPAKPSELCHVAGDGPEALHIIKEFT